MMMATGIIALCSLGAVTGFVMPAGQAAAGLAASPQHARVLLSAARGDTYHWKQRCLSSSSCGPHRRRQPLCLQMQSDGPSQWAGGGINVSGEAPFEIRGFSLANAAGLVGLAVTSASFFEYFSTGGAGGLSGIGFVYGIPIALIGLALKYAELPPAPLQTTPEAEALFEEKATETMRTIKKDVTRHRYGDEAHLDTTVKFLGLVMPQSDYPQLQYISQTIEPNGELGFSMVFQSKMTPFKRWVQPERVQKYVKFFGPGVDAEVRDEFAAIRAKGSLFGWEELAVLEEYIRSPRGLVPDLRYAGDFSQQVIKVDAQEKLVAIKLTTLPPGVQPSPKVPAEDKVAEGAAPPAQEA